MISTQPFSEIGPEDIDVPKTEMRLVGAITVDVSEKCAAPSDIHVSDDYAVQAQEKLQETYGHSAVFVAFSVR